MVSQLEVSTYEYLSVDECIRRNGDRHLINAFNHSQAGNITFAIGSLKKAIKNYERAKALTIPEWMIKPFRIMIIDLQTKMVERIINGS